MVSPGLTSPAFTAEPKPVGTPHDQRREVERDVVVDLHDRGLRQHRVLRERPEQAHLPEVGGALVVAERPVGQAVVQQEAAKSHRFVWPRAQNRHFRRPAGKRPTTWSPGASPVTPSPTLDHARALVAAHDRVADRDVAGAQVVVGVAEPGGGELDEDLAVFGSSRSSSTTSKGLPTSLSTAARVFMQHPPGDERSLAVIFRQPPDTVIVTSTQ